MTMRNIGKNNIWVFRQILAKKCAEVQNKIDKDYRHDFSKKEPVLKLTIEISAVEFNAAVLESQNEILTKQLERARKKLKVLEEKLNPPKLVTVAEQLQIDADDDMGFDFEDEVEGCPRCHSILTGSGDCVNCEYPGPPV